MRYLVWGNVDSDDAPGSATRHHSAEITGATSDVEHVKPLHVTARLDHRRPEEVQPIVVHAAVLGIGVCFRCGVPLTANCICVKMSAGSW